jgi:hypothetical protein
MGDKDDRPVFAVLALSVELVEQVRSLFPDACDRGFEGDIGIVAEEEDPCGRKRGR